MRVSFLLTSPFFRAHLHFFLQNYRLRWKTLKKMNHKSDKDSGSLILSWNSRMPIFLWKVPEILKFMTQKVDFLQN